MSAPIRPEPDDTGWLAADAKRRLGMGRGRQMGPSSPFAPADASAVRSTPTPPTMMDYARVLRQMAAGGMQGVAQLPADAVAMLKPFLFDAGPGGLRTIGRGEVRTGPVPPGTTSYTPIADRLETALRQMAQGVGDFYGGGPPATSSLQDFRDIGGVGGNLLAWNELPGLARKLAVPREGGAWHEFLTGLRQDLQGLGDGPPLFRDAAVADPLAGAPAPTRRGYARHGFDRETGMLVPYVGPRPVLPADVEAMQRQLAGLPPFEPQF